MREVILPYLSATQDVWSLGGWQLTTEGARRPLGDRLDHWDYSIPLDLSCEIEVDIDQLRAVTKLSDADRLTFVCLWEASATGIREVGYAADLPANGVAVGEPRLDLDSSLLGGNLRLLRQVVLTSVGAERDLLAADRVGSVILGEEAADAKVVALEGIAARFPTELVDFSDLPIAEPDALWYLDIESADLDTAALAAMRLYLNSSHPAISRALDPEDPAGALVRSTIRWDVARTVITEAAQNPDLIRGWGGFPEDSLGDAMEGMIRRYWPGETAESLRERRRGHAARFEYQLQARLRLMAEP